MTSAAVEVGVKEIAIRGRGVRVPCVAVDGQWFTVTGGMLRTATLDDEWYADVADPRQVIETLRDVDGLRIDLFSFWQRLPERDARHPYHREVESVAALRVESYAHWLQRQASGKVRNMLRKAEKSGVTVRECAFDDTFVRAMAAIFNESRVRQGRPFWHYGKSEALLRRQFSRNLHRERLYGAFWRDEMIGFVMLADAGRYALLTQIISLLRHRDKAVSNALLAAAVEATAGLGRPHLVYANWTPGPLADFKRRNGFEKVDLPRYYVPLTARGALAIRAGVHRGWTAALPAPLYDALRDAKRRWYAGGGG